MLVVYSVIVLRLVSGVSHIVDQYTVPMLRLFSSKVLGHKNFREPSKPCHVGIYCIALVEYSQISTYVSGFQSFLKCFFVSFCIGQIT